MRIRSLLFSFMTAALSLTLVLGACIGRLATESGELAQREQQARKRSQQVSSLLVLAHEFALHREPRTAQQWRLLHAQVVKDLQNKLKSSADSQEASESLASAELLGTIFAQLLETNEPVDAQPPNEATQDLQRQRSALLLDQLLLNSQVLTDSVQRWGHHADQRRSQLEKNTRRLAIAIPVLMLLILAWLALLLNRRILKPLKHLEETVSAISQGDLTQRSATRTQDEFGELSAHFDAMAVDLVSELRHEVAVRKQAEAQLQLSASVFTHAREGIMITDPAGAIIDVNETFSQITGYSRDEVLGRNPRLLSSGRHDKVFYIEFWNALLNQGMWTGEIWNRRKTGEIYAEMQTISAVRDEQGQVKQYLSLFSDITTLKEHESQLKNIAYHDALTGLPNRLLLNDRLQHAMLQSKRRKDMLALVYLDLDGFKSVNDRHGHAIGDALLVGIAKNIKLALREGDTLARLGGDEFIVLLVDIYKQSDCGPMLERILGAASAPVNCSGLSLQISASLGVAYYPQAAEVNATQLLQQADQAMYEAKHEGKNRFRISGLGELT
ncbi:diguanylate cyclase domain-containing protein [Roseateles oligotrophus]|uniref:Diguanylate cyclase n=1 Tax=Roseateles oligotrophus TaxID=1769250 RepID=A0ABT2YFL0_9BURK|nr:diguanylate cyclase [Roseateles oligotrophus]MCV2368840.1 diguanylate cyclase [Roseateles oligotrophus]